MISSGKLPERNFKDELNNITDLRHLDLSGRVLYDSPILKAHGGYCDVFTGRLMNEGVCSYNVAIKRVRVHVQRDKDFARVSSTLCYISFSLFFFTQAFSHI